MRLAKTDAWRYFPTPSISTGSVPKRFAMLQQERDYMNSMFLTLRLMGGYNEFSYVLLALKILFVSVVASLCDSCSIVSVENL